MGNRLITSTIAQRLEEYNFGQSAVAEAIVRSTRPLSLLIGALLIAPLITSQNVNPMHPEQIQVQKHPSPDDMRARGASLQLQKDAKELGEICASVPSDLAGVNQGFLPQDVVDKLKRMEKLSKRVREQLTQYR